MKVFVSEMGSFFAIYTGAHTFVHIPESTEKIMIDGNPFDVKIRATTYIIPSEKNSDKMVEVPEFSGCTIESIIAIAKEKFQLDKSLGNP